MSGSRIRPKDPDNHDIKQGTKVTISTSRYGDRRTEPMKKKNGRANVKKNIGMSEETFCPCRRAAAVRPAPLRTDLPASKDDLAAMLACHLVSIRCVDPHP